jgi:hypothetical protein
MKKESRQLVLSILQRQSQFAELPILWKPSKKGPAFRVTRTMGDPNVEGSAGRISVEINFKGLSFDELQTLVNKILVYANEMYREQTRASVITAREYVPEEPAYIPTPLELWREGMSGAIEEMFGSREIH